MNAVDRARKALLGYDRWWNDGGSTSSRPEHSEWAAIVRDLLAMTPGMLTEDNCIEIGMARDLLNDAMISLWVRERVRWLLAIIDRLAPPPLVAHKPCPHCGGRATACGLRTSQGPHIRCTNNDCDSRTTSKASEAEAWQAWDRRTDGGTE